MADDKIVTLAVYSNVVEAHLARNRLVAEDVPVQIDSESGAGPLPGMESMFASVRLLVPESQAERAAQILGFDEEEEHEPEGEPDDDPTRQAIRAVHTDGLQAAEEGESSPETAVRRAEPGERPTRTEAEPPLPIPLEDDEDFQEKIGGLVSSTVDTFAARALRAAVIAAMFSALLFLTPCVPTILVAVALGYSIWQLIRMATLSHEPSPAGIRQMYAAIAIDIFLIILLPLVWLGMLHW